MKFLMASIQHGGNIHNSTRQETLWFKVKRLVIHILLLFCLHLANIQAADSNALMQPGSHRARVVIVQDQQATVTFNPRAEKIRKLMASGLMAVTSKETPELAWRSLLSTQDMIGIKVYSSPGASAGTRPAVVEALVESLLNAGFSSNRIVIWDKRLVDLRLAGFAALAQSLGVGLSGSADESYEPSIFYESPLLGKLVWGDFEFGKKGEGLGRKSYVSKLLTQRLTKVIHVTPLLNHNLTGVSGNLLGMTFGSVDNSIRFELEPDRLADAIPEIYALQPIGDKVALNIVDALLCQYQGEERGLLHYSTVLNQLRFSLDPVALDVLSIQELDRQRQRARIAPVKTNMQIYENASVLDLGVSNPRQINVETISTLPETSASARE